MRDKKRIKKILKKIEKIWSQKGYVDLRFFQLIEYFKDSIGKENCVYYYYEDESLEQFLDGFLKDSDRASKKL